MNLNDLLERVIQLEKKVAAHEKMIKELKNLGGKLDERTVGLIRLGPQR
jgi:uncharacterized coiled-coil protein SlyX